MTKRRDDYDDYDSYGWGGYGTRIRRDDGIQSRSKGGAFASSWWGKRWLEVLNSYGLESRMQRGRSYARSGQVLNVDVEPGLVKAKVQGSQRTPYRVSIGLPLLKADEWERVLDAIAEQAIFSAQLLNGEMPQEIEQAFNQAGVPLFPKAQKDLVTDCSCPDMSNPCKHIAAVYYLLAEQFDVDPFLIFTLRGRTRDQIIEALRARRATAAGPSTGEETPVALPSAPPLGAQLATFWQMSETPEPDIRFDPPEVQAAVLRRLGASPEGTRPALEAIYAAMTAYTLAKVLGDQEPAAPAPAKKRPSA